MRPSAPAACVGLCQKVSMEVTPVVFGPRQTSPQDAGEFGHDVWVERRRTIIH